MTNETIHLLHTHHSIRSYTDQPIDDVMLDQIVEAAYRGPTSFNAQGLSLVVVRDAAKRAELAKIAGGQPWIEAAPVFIALVIDYNKTAQGVAKAGAKQMTHESVEGFLAGVLDAGIAMGNLMIAARALGLGIVPIGGVRRDPQALIDLLKLPPMTFPVGGICVGHIKQEAPLKPRMPMESFRHDEVYNQAVIAKSIEAYDRELVAYWEKIGRGDGQAWSESIAGPYQRVYFPDVQPVARKQGFLNDK